jgi:RNA polymerase sigma-70 factor (ECF subfamily)
MDDTTVIERVLAGEHDAYEVLVHRHAPAVTALAGRFLGDRDAAEDAAQEAFIRAFTRLDRYEARLGAFRNWLLRITANTCINELRRRERRVRHEESGGADALGSVVEPDTEGREARVATVREALQELPPAERQALLLAYYHDMPYREIAGLFGIPLGTVKSRIHCAVTRLRRRLVTSEEGNR